VERSKLKKIALIASLSALALVGATLAFLTSTDNTVNKFTVGKVALKIEEDFDEDQKLSAGQIITKQPSVKNTGSVKELFFAEVYLPRMKAAFLDADGQRIVPDGVTLSEPPKAEEFLQTQVIFNLLAGVEDGTEKGYILEPTDKCKWEFSYNKATNSAAGWEYLELTDISPRTEDITKVQGMMDGSYDIYLLGYSEWVAPDKVTIPIFDRLQMRSVVDADIAEGTVGQVQINAYTIQADALEISGLSGDGTADHPYSADDLKKIYAVVSNKEATP